MNGNNGQAPGVLSLFQDGSGLNNFNENGVPFRSILVNNAFQDFFDQTLISRSQEANDTADNFEIIGIDADPTRSERTNFGFNFFRVGEAQSGGLSPSNQRRAMVIDGSTGELLANIQPGLISAATENQTLIDAINSVTLGEVLEPFTEWAVAQIGDEGARGFSDDPDGDGMSNLLEFFFATDPEVADADSGPRFTTFNGETLLTYRRSTTGEIGSEVIEMSSSLEPGSFEVMEIADPVIADQGDFELVTVAMPVGAERQFIRIRVQTEGE